MPILSFDPLVLNAVSMAIDQTSEIISIGEIGGYSVHSVFTGSPVGLLVVSGSNNIDMEFVPVDAYSVTAQGSRLLNIERANYVYIKVSYVATSGTGSLTVRVSGKII